MNGDRCDVCDGLRTEQHSVRGAGVCRECYEKTVEIDKARRAAKDYFDRLNRRSEVLREYPELRDRVKP